MKRPRPTKELISQVTAGKYFEIDGEPVAKSVNSPIFLAKVCFGMHEIPTLKSIYPLLNLDEALVAAYVFADARGSEIVRSKVPNRKFLELVDKKDLHAIFDYVNNHGFPMLNAGKRVSKDLDLKYNLMNPYGRDIPLIDRLAEVDAETSERLFDNLRGSGNAYSYRVQHGVTESGCHEMFWFRIFPKTFDSKLRGYSAYAARMFKSYPTDIKTMDGKVEHPIVESVAPIRKTVEKVVEDLRKVQLSLF